MNFVIFSIGFLPDRGAESWCTSRFAGALAHCGHNVQVVTPEHNGEISNDVWDLIVGPRVKVIRVKQHAVRKPIVARARYFTYEWDAVNYDAFIKAVRQALNDMPDSVLVTRSNPLASTIVGWHCRKFASKWVAHLSDPIPIPGRENDWKCLHGYVNRFWMRRTLRAADVVSVTCPNAIRAYKDEYGTLADGVKFVVTPHIGDPVLSLPQNRSETSDGVVRVVHHGVMCGGRGAPELAAAIKRLNADGVPCEFVQCGQIDDVGAVFEETPNVYREEKCSPDIEYIPDLIVPLPYCPFLSSKFVYRIFDDTPILLRTQNDSMSAQLARQNTNAGIVVVSEDDDMLLKVHEAIKLIGQPFDRTNLRRLFSRGGIVNDFTTNI